MALLIWHGVIPRDFPWLPLTTLQHGFADQYFIYHVALAPFLAVFGPLYGMHVGTAVFSGCAVAAFTWFLQSRGVSNAWFWGGLLVLTPGFLFRIGLPKAIGFSVAMLFVGLWLMQRGRSRSLFFWAWAYVWAYGAWPLLAVACAAELSGRLLWHWLSEGERTSNTTLRELWAWREARNLQVVLAGNALGVLLNPYFPGNLRFYWEQTVHIALINYGKQVSVGGEWAPLGWWELVAKAWPIFAVILVALALAGARQLTRVGLSASRSLEAPNSCMLSLSALALLFMVLAMKSRRNVEYFAPLGLAASALFWQYLFGDVEALSERCSKGAARFVRSALLTAALLAAAAWGGAREVAQSLRGGMPWTAYEKVSTWLRNNTPPRALVVHANWADFPSLFLHNDSNTYVAGLDATFLFREDKKLYREWIALVEGRTQQSVAGLLTNRFHARYALATKGERRYLELLRRSEGLRCVYSDSEAEVYEVIGRR
ncbi:MAG: hypothetical protein SFV15_17500 [Polyangiaceae bacterium]|nr:hypothetical protein [Polyangiaceae bacterium]